MLSFALWILSSTWLLVVYLVLLGCALGDVMPWTVTCLGWHQAFPDGRLQLSWSQMMQGRFKTCCFPLEDSCQVVSQSDTFRAIHCQHQWKSWEGLLVKGDHHRRMFNSYRYVESKANMTILCKKNIPCVWWACHRQSGTCRQSLLNKPSHWITGCRQGPSAF